MEASLQLRLAQMRNFRDLLAQRERCLAEERRAFEAQRRDSEAQCQQERAALLAEREHAEAFRADELRLRDARRQRLSVELDQIERRREEIDALHARLAILLADLQRSLPAHEETPGEAPASHLVQLLQLIARQLAELEESRRQLTAHQQARREEDLALSAWVEAREAWIRERETAFERQLEDLTEREQHWRGEREQWRSERMQVEQLIRDLVLQLESAPSEASGNVGARSVSEETRHPDDAGTFSIASDAA
jgi:hypothetical protein